MLCLGSHRRRNMFTVATTARAYDTSDDAESDTPIVTTSAFCSECDDCPSISLNNEENSGTEIIIRDRFGREIQMSMQEIKALLAKGMCRINYLICRERWG